MNSHWCVMEIKVIKSGTQMNAQQQIINLIVDPWNTHPEETS